VKLLRFLPLLLSVMVLACCKEHEPNSNRNLTLEYYQDLQNPNFAINSHVVRDLMDSLMRNDDGTTVSDLHTKRYYRNHGGFLWVDRRGIDHRADTLLSYLKRVEEMGFDAKQFYVAQITRDLEKLQHLQLGEGRDDVNHVMARLEYRLTKSYLRYVGGQRFGFVNPTFVLNRLDSIEPNPHDTIKRPTSYRGLFDVKMQHADDAFYKKALRLLVEANERTDGEVLDDGDNGNGGYDGGENGETECGKLAAFLREVQPKNPFYYELQEKLLSPHLGKQMRAKILVNMERCRWRQADHPELHKKYVMVNIPSFHLLAIDGKDTLSMRIGCGATKTKTPLLNSNIKRMDLNPNWFVPRSIIVKDMVRHAGSTAYFHSRNYYITDRSTGKEVNPAQVNRSMLLSGNYGVVQRGGKGNALGRIIFRFDNNFSVYLHDTSSRGVFGREDRGVSHGCVRVEKPFELAKFLLKDKDEKLIERINYSMTADSLANKKLVVGSVKLEPQVPLFIAYYTLFPMANGMVNYPDVYGYDKVIFEHLRKYLQ